MMKFASPLYDAVIECMPMVSDDVTSVACPNPLTVTFPRTTFPSVNVIVPVGVPAPGNTTFTAAANVTAFPTLDGFKLKGFRLDGFRLDGFTLDGFTLDGFRLDAKIADVSALFTFWVPDGEVLALKLFVSP